MGKDRRVNGFGTLVFRVSYRQKSKTGMGDRKCRSPIGPLLMLIEFDNISATYDISHVLLSRIGWHFYIMMALIFKTTRKADNILVNMPHQQ